MLYWENVLGLVCIPSHQWTTRSTARLSAHRFVSAASCPPYIHLGSRAPLMVHFAVDENIFAPFTNPAAVVNFELNCVLFSVRLHMLIQNSSLLSTLTAVWSRGWISLCHSLNRWTMHLQAFGSSHRINQAFVCFIYLFLVTDFFFPSSFLCC